MLNSTSFAQAFPSSCAILETNSANEEGKRFFPYTTKLSKIRMNLGSPRCSALTPSLPNSFFPFVIGWARWQAQLVQTPDNAGKKFSTGGWDVSQKNTPNAEAIELFPMSISPRMMNETV
ncbi:hypothetical protein NPIL_494721 [Nephila pilipes]|uniref:Uncharacterized protein n=1 Tax=Nephila pilipes TaxID=299642 RepID=A0A8X6MUX4_NEPPI|nr:hypothetical protein NPIL_494721 [Nephila pilipes]